MKTTFLASFICLGMLLSGFAQSSNRAAVNLSYNQVTLSYRKDLVENLLRYGLYLGVGNQDIDTRFNDYLVGVSLYIPVFEKNRFSLSTAVDFGFYIPQNQSYSAPTPVLSFFLEGERRFGNNLKHSLLLDLGYRYGKKSYMQEFENSFIHASTRDVFKVSPIILTLGYGFRF